MVSILIMQPGMSRSVLILFTGVLMARKTEERAKKEQRVGAQESTEWDILTDGGLELGLIDREVKLYVVG